MNSIYYAIYLPYFIIFILAIVVFIKSIKNKNSRNKFYLKLHISLMIISFLYLYTLSFFHVGLEIIYLYSFMFLEKLLNIIGIIINICKKIYYNEIQEVNKKVYIAICLISFIPIIIVLTLQIFLLNNSDFIIKIEYGNNRTFGSSQEIIYSVNKDGCTKAYINPYKFKFSFKNNDDSVLEGTDYSIKKDYDQIIIYKNNEILCKPNAEGNINLDDYEIYR